MKLRALLLPLLLLPSLAFGQGFVNCNSPNATCKAGKFSLVAGKQLCLNSTTCTTWIQASTSTGGMRLNSGVANSGSNAAYSLDTTTTLTGNTLILNIGTGGSQRLYVSNDGSVVVVGSGTGVGYGLANSAPGTVGIDTSGTTVRFHASGGGFQFTDNSVNQLLLTATTATFPGKILPGGTPSSGTPLIGGTFASGFGISFPDADNSIYFRTGSNLGGAHRFVDVNGNSYAIITSDGLDMSGSSSGTQGKVIFRATDSSGTPGNATVNKASGQAAFAGAASAVTITNSNVSATSICNAIMQATDATCTSVISGVPASGSVAFNANAACTGATKFGWVCFN